MAATDPTDCADYIGKWRAREPEMAFAEPFCPRSQRTRFRLWGALLLELREAAFELSDARVIEAKSAWWAEELARCAQHTARHPLTQALVRDVSTPLAWPQLANGVLASAASDPRPVDSDAAIAGMQPLAEGILVFEAGLFGSAPFEAGRERAQHAAGSNAVVAHLLAERLRVGLRSEDGGRIPLSMLARHRITTGQLAGPAGAAATSEWARHVLALTSARIAGFGVYRSARAAFDRRSLQRIAQHRTATAPPPLRALWLAWGAARGGFRPESLPHDVPTG